MTNRPTFSEIVSAIGKTDKNSTHTYAQWYNQWFEPFRDKNIAVLEVGVCVFGGGGLLSLAEYFQEASIWGIDNQCAACVEEVTAHPRIKLIDGDAYKPETLARLPWIRFDIIIDDASHEVADQIKLLKMLRPMLQHDGIYIVEDCCTEHWLPHMKELRSLGLKSTIIDMQYEEANGRTVYDNTLVKFELV